MTRLLYWNVENFAINKIVNPNTKKRKSGSSVDENTASQNRLYYIGRVFNRTTPDIFVLVECETAYSGRGQLVQGGGRDGSLQLLAELRNWDGNAWMLVPPIQTGPNEAVSVFYDSTNLYFAGPYRWPGGDAGPVAAYGIAAGQYPADLRAGLPVGRNVPANCVWNAGQPEARMAAKVRFNRASDNSLIDWGVTRAPYMVAFYDTANNRDITVFGIHSPALAYFARNYMDELAEVDRIVEPADNDEVRVVIGDFNMNLLKTDLTPYDGYTPLTDAGLTLVLEPNANPPAPAGGYAGYYATHIRGQYSAEICSTLAETRYYPGFGYIGSEVVSNTYAIDNAYTLYGANVAQPGNNQFTIMNGVVGTRMNVVNPSPGNAPQGTTAMPRMCTSPPVPIPAQGPPYDAGLTATFQSWVKYGVVRSTSDHFALSMVI